MKENIYLREKKYFGGFAYPFFFYTILAIYFF